MIYQMVRYFLVPVMVMLMMMSLMMLMSLSLWRRLPTVHHVGSPLTSLHAVSDVTMLLGFGDLVTLASLMR